jgi:predicted Zn-dependent protease
MTALTASVDGKKRLWPVPKDRLEELRERTEIYRQFRKARARLIKEQRKRQREMLRVIDAIAKARIRQP